MDSLGFMKRRIVETPIHDSRSTIQRSQPLYCTSPICTLESALCRAGELFHHVDSLRLVLGIGCAGALIKSADCYHPTLLTQRRDNATRTWNSSQVLSKPRGHQSAPQLRGTSPFSTPSPVCTTIWTLQWTSGGPPW